MKIMNRLNETKAAFESEKNKSRMDNQYGFNAKHNKKAVHVAYPEEKNEACTCPVSLHKTKK